MSKAKLNFRNLSVTAKLAKAKQIVTALTGNPNFPNPNPSLSAVIAVIMQTETTLAERDAAQQLAKTKTTELNTLEDKLDRVLSQLAAYVDSAAGGDEVKILSAGLDTRAAATSTTNNPTQPERLHVTAGDHEGELDASWDTVPGARSYVIETSEDPPTPTSWKHTGVSTKSRYTIERLESGKRHWVRVAAINTIGQSGWSDPAMKIAP
jgi:hypothetical protein